ncbi:hypothetical protein ABTE17_20235, partial [Acinetobacter baumannii]
AALVKLLELALSVLAPDPLDTGPNGNTNAAKFTLAGVGAGVLSSASQSRGWTIAAFIPDKFMAVGNAMVSAPLLTVSV